MILHRIIIKFGTILNKHQRHRIIELGIIMLIGGFMEMISVSAFLPFMESVTDMQGAMDKWYAKIICEAFHISSEHDYIVFLSIVLACLFVLKNAYLLMEFNLQTKFVSSNRFDLQKRLLHSLMERPYEFFLYASTGEIIRIVNTDTTLAFALLTTLLNLFTELIVSGILLVTVFVIAPFISVAIAIILLVILFLINRIIKPILEETAKQSQYSGAEANKWLIQSIEGIKEIKVANKEDFFEDNYNKYEEQVIRANQKKEILIMAPRFIIEAVCMAFMFLLIGGLFYFGTDYKDVIPIISVIAMAAVRILPSINRISNAIGSMAFGETMLDKTIENLKDLNVNLRMDSNYIEDGIKNGGKGTIKDLRKSIDFSKVSFSYFGSKDRVLFESNIQIKKGESVGIVGESGAGKTTVVDIMLGLLIPQSGVVSIDGVPIEKDETGWLSQVGYIPQSIFMLDGTVRDNVAFGEIEEEIDEKVWKALDEASLGNYVRNLPDQLDTQIGERGVRLSGGQRQRIGIARALFRNPNVLVFDEATSALDNKTENSIMEAIKKLQGLKTMIIIAHRLSTIDSCDHIYRVRNGKIIQER